MIVIRHRSYILPIFALPCEFIWVDTSMRQQSTDSYVPFMDVLLMRQGSTIKTKVYRKPTHTEVYTNNRSQHPWTIKASAMKTLACRAHRLSDSPEDLEEELEHLIDVFCANGFKHRVVERTIRGYVPNGEKRERSKTMLYIPYVDSKSEALRGKLLDLEVELVFSRGRTLRSELCQGMKYQEPRNSIMDESGVIYAIPCTQCKSYYIGETGRKLGQRISEHKNDCRNAKETSGPFDLSKNN